MPEQQFITIDIGSAWTKAFLVHLDSINKVNIERATRLPTSSDYSTTIEILLSKISVRDTPKVFVSHVREAESLADKYKATFVAEQDAASSLVKYFKTDHKDVSILDGGASNFLETFQAEDVGKLLTFAAESLFLENFLGKKRFRPHLLPVDTRELEIEEALLRNNFANKLAARDKNAQNNLLLTGGLLSGSPRLSRLAIVILDILDKEEVAQVLLDREFFLPSFGSLLQTHKRLFSADTGSWLDNLGAFVSLGASLPVQLDWGYSQIQNVRLSEGEISIIPVPAGQTIKLTFSVDNKRKKTIDIIGGSLGVVLDARSKPLELIFGQASSRNAMSSWFKQIEAAETAKEVF